MEVACGNVHGIFVYHVDDMIPAGAECMVEVTRQAVSDLRDLLWNKYALNLPRTGIFQFDNCGENKNKYMFCYFTLLVELGFLDEVYVFFLLVGHTHVKIDQIFSIFASAIFVSHFIGSPEALWDLLQGAHQNVCDQPLLQKSVDVVYAFKEFCDPFVNEAIKHYQIPHCFFFHKPSPSSNCSFQYSLFSAEDNVWLPTQGPTELSTVVVPNCPLVGGFESFFTEEFSTEERSSYVNEAAEAEAMFSEAEAKAQSELVSCYPAATRLHPEVSSYSSLYRQFRNCNFVIVGRKRSSRLDILVERIVLSATTDTDNAPSG